MRPIIPIQQTNEPVLANAITITPETVGDVVYFNWTLFADSLYINNGSISIYGETIDEYNNNEDWSYSYVAVVLSIEYTE
jgi:hypothetical protein